METRDDKSVEANRIEDLQRALFVLRNLSFPMLHDLKRMDMLLDVWEDEIAKVPHKRLKDIVAEMKSWITAIVDNHDALQKGKTDVSQILPARTF